MTLLFILLILLLHPVGFGVSLFLGVLPSTRSCFLREHCIITAFFLTLDVHLPCSFSFFQEKNWTYKCDAMASSKVWCARARMFTSWILSPLQDP